MRSSSRRRVVVKRGPPTHSFDGMLGASMAWRCGWLARQCAAIAERTNVRRTPRWGLAAAAAALCLVAAVLVFVFRHPAPRGGAVAGTVVEAPMGQPLPITLLDGSKVVLAPKTKLSLMTLLANDIQLQLLAGSADFDVTHVENRRFVVSAGGYEVRVIGTQFTTRLTGSSLEVHVARGRVRVTRSGDADDVRVLGEGETWSAGVPSALEATTSAAPPSEPRSATAEQRDPIDPPPNTAATAGETSVPPTSPPHGDAHVDGPKELLARAEAARASNRPREAASALHTLRSRFRSDPRAGLAKDEGQAERPRRWMSSVGGCHGENRVVKRSLTRDPLAYPAGATIRGEPAPGLDIAPKVGAIRARSPGFRMA